MPADCKDVSSAEEVVARSHAAASKACVDCLLHQLKLGAGVVHLYKLARRPLNLRVVNKLQHYLHACIQTYLILLCKPAASLIRQRHSGRTLGYSGQLQTASSDALPGDGGAALLGGGPTHAVTDL